MRGYPQTLKYFMWPYQVYFRVTCMTSAERLFDHFDRNLKPNVLLIGIASHPDKKNSLCFEPEEQDLFASDFKTLGDTVKNILENDPDKDMLYSGPGMQEEMDIRRKREALRKAVEITLTKSAKNKLGYQYHCSQSVLIGGYHVHVVVGLVKEVYESHTYLKIKELEDQRIRLYQSILETAVEAFLEDKWKNLNIPDAGKNLSMDTRPTEDLLKEAARKFMYTVSSKGKEFMGLHGLFDACDDISTFLYEGSPNTGHLIIAEKSDPALEMVFELKRPFEISDLRKTRKLLQLSNKYLGVICDSHNIYGLGRILPGYAKSNETIFNIHFISTHCWRVKHQDNVVLEMRYGQPEFTTEVIPWKKFKATIKRIFLEISDDKIENIYKLSISATNQAKGAMLVVANDAEEEAERLKIQCLPIEPVSLTEESVLQLTSIDGALLLNMEGTAYAYSVILDGIVGEKGDASRGSRYNSAITYLEFRGNSKPTLIVVVSEDGFVDILPILRPKVKHSEIQNNVTLLEALANQTELNISLFNRLMGYFINKIFYLTQEECNKINEYRKIIESKRNNITVRILYDDLSPNPEMNDTYYEVEN